MRARYQGAADGDGGRAGQLRTGQGGGCPGEVEREDGQDEPGGVRGELARGRCARADPSGRRGRSR